MTRPTSSQVRAALQAQGALPEQVDALLGAPRQPRRRSGPTPESVVLRDVLHALRSHPRVAWCQRMNVGAQQVGDRYIRFGFKGCADIIGQLRDGRFLAVECKARSNVTTEEQADFLRLVARNGGVAFVARSVEDVERGIV